MAADVILVAVPHTVGNLEAARHLADVEQLPGDQWWLDEDGTAAAISHGEQHRALRRWLVDDPRAPFLPLGPVSYTKAVLLGDAGWLPTPTVLVHELWAWPQVVTPALVTQTMVLLNLPDRSYYSQRRYYARRWRARRPTTPRRRVRRWLTAHHGWIVWAETW